MADAAVERIQTLHRARGTPADDVTIANDDDRKPLALLTVTGGRHKHAMLPVFTPEFMVGSALDCAVVLTDPGIEPHHCIVSIDRQLLRTRLQVFAADGPVSSNGTAASRGDQLDLALPATFRIGGAEVVMSRPPRRRVSLKKLLLLPLLLALAAAVGYAYSTLSPAVMRDFGGLLKSRSQQGEVASSGPTQTAEAPAARPTSPTGPDAGKVLPGALPDVPPAEAPRADVPRAGEPSRPLEKSAVPERMPAAPAAAPAPVPATGMVRAPAEKAAIPAAPAAPADVQDLRQRIARSGLTASDVTVEKRGNALVADGMLDSDRHARWREAKQAFLASNSQSIVVDMVKFSTAVVAPRGLVASVVLGTSPFVLSASGRRARVGEMVDDGWIVESIRSDSVQLKRGQSVTTIPLTGGGFR